MKKLDKLFENLLAASETAEKLDGVAQAALYNARDALGSYLRFKAAEAKAYADGYKKALQDIYVSRSNHRN